VTAIILAFLIRAILLNGIQKNSIKICVIAVILAFIKSVILLNDNLVNVVGPSCWWLRRALGSCGSIVEKDATTNTQMTISQMTISQMTISRICWLLPQLIDHIIKTWHFMLYWVHYCYISKLKKGFRDKHASLFCNIISDEEKGLTTLTPGAGTIKLFRAVIPMFAIVSCFHPNMEKNLFGFTSLLFSAKVYDTRLTVKHRPLSTTCWVF
jgi:hypothetical protein